MRLLAESERAKICLSTSQETHVELGNVDPECPLAAEGLLIRREVMERLASKLIQRTFIACDEALTKASMRPGDIRGVLLAGGTSEMPIIRQGIESYFGRSGCADVDPVEVVALGASLSSSV
jgi:molecular chaperone DnaK (HSP70)